MQFHSKAAFRLFFGALLLVFVAGVEGAVFTSPEKITDAAGKYQLSRISNHLMALDGSGTLRVVYWSGLIATSPSTPSYIYYREWNSSSGWGTQQAIDDSESGGQHVGGRHPTLALLANGGVWVVWHDARHCTVAGNWIDNLEIYGDFMPSGGNFSASDSRLSTSSAIHLGDSGYTSRIAVAPGSSTASIAWYDFHVDGSVSDIYLKTSDASGVFNLSQTMASMQMTDKNDRGNAPSFAVPDLAVASDGARHIVWAGGFGSDVNLYYASAMTTATSVTEQILAPAGTDFFDPPHIEIAPNGDVWIAYGDDAASPNENIVLLRKRAGQPTFDAAINAKATSAREYLPDHEIDASGLVHLVWIDERSGRHVYYGVYDPLAGMLTEEVRITESSANWSRPTLALGAGGEVYVLFEKDVNINVGEIWFATTFQLNATDPAIWGLYE